MIERAEYRTNFPEYGQDTPDAALLLSTSVVTRFGETILVKDDVTQEQGQRFANPTLDARITASAVWSSSTDCFTGHDLLHGGLRKLPGYDRSSSRNSSSNIRLRNSYQKVVIGEYSTTPHEASRSPGNDW